MRFPSSENDKPRTKDLRAAIFVDYENLFSYLHGRIGSRGRPEEFINELLEELRRYLLEEARTQTAMTAAYADFSEMHGSGQFVQRALYLQGIEPRFVPMTLQRNAAEIQLCVDAVDTLYSRPDINTIIMVTGDRRYLPLVQQIKR
ncbi:MAG TPA: NYN domain-containing protein, partial [Rhodothermales bacterium]|nr:NYN domain-containing protein [Rhodothermales bacterium]